jgi:hypothetical protein
MDMIFQLLMTISFIIPFLLIYSAGIILSLLKRKNIGKPATFALIGFTLLLINSLIDIIHFSWLVLYANQSSSQFISTVMMIRGIAATLFGIAGFIFLLFAIFVKRDFSNQT